jgi:hypothetical protein
MERIELVALGSKAEIKKCPDTNVLWLSPLRRLRPYGAVFFLLFDSSIAPALSGATNRTPKQGLYPPRNLLGRPDVVDCFTVFVFTLVAPAGFAFFRQFKPNR